MSTTNLTIRSSNGQRQDGTLPLQPIPASHPSNHRMNVATGSEEKSGLPIPCRASAGEPTAARPEPSSENSPPAVADTAVEMAETEGYPLEHYPDATEEEMHIRWEDGRTSRAGQRGDDDLDASLNSRAPPAQYADAFDAEDERRMVIDYIRTRYYGKVWPCTRYCGQAPIIRRHNVAWTLHEELIHNRFACAVNDATTAMGGEAYCEVPPIHDCEREQSDVGVRRAGKGSIHALRNVQHFRALPFHYCDGSGKRQQASSHAEAADEVSVFESDEEVETESGDPETEEWDGEYDETETF